MWTWELAQGCLEANMEPRNPVTGFLRVLLCPSKRPYNLRNGERVDTQLNSLKNPPQNSLALSGSFSKFSFA
jgi:hypothetical protein